MIANIVKQQNVVLTKQLEQYKERVWVFKTNTTTKTNVQKEFNEADHKAKRLETELQNQFIRDRNKIGALEKERDNLQLNVSEQIKHVLEIQTAQTVLERKLNANEDNDLDATWKQNEILNDQLLEATLKHDVEKCVLMCFDSMNDDLTTEIEKVKRESIDVHENLHKRIKILKYEVQRCQKQSNGSKSIATSSGGNRNVDPGVAQGPDTQTTLPINSAFQTDDLDAVDLDCDEAPSTRVVLMANLSSYDSDVILEDFNKGLYVEINEMKAVFKQMEYEVEQCYVHKKCFEIHKKELFLKNDRLLELIISQGIVHTAVNSYAAIVDYEKMEKNFVDEYNECLKFKAKLSKKNEMVEKVVYNELSKRCSRIKNHCISLEIEKQQLKEHANSKFVCSTCNDCLFSTNHDKCVVAYLNDVNSCVKSKSGKSIKKEWKSTGKVFTSVGHRWLPTGRTITIVGIKCPMTRITSTKVVPPRESLQTTVIIKIPSSSASNRKPKVTKSVSSSEEPSILGLRPSNNSEPNINWGSTISNSPSSSRVHRRFVNDQVARIMGYGDYQIENVKISNVYYVEGVGHNLFSVGHFCDSDLEVAF
ncbi:hypothetical protein Tco_1113780 [Tanacetum coccineum]|uniref:Integrase, catalytic region, zinc finger, CCHC-type, peptidase aspartic, catalytic n=1 Tax=Tanacetum coccineum TaxID=301880 RepID=A0ABQ5IT91_9ASTR